MTSTLHRRPSLPSVDTHKTPAPKKPSPPTTSANKSKERPAISDEDDIESIFRSVPLPSSDREDEDYVEGGVGASGKSSASRKTSAGTSSSINSSASAGKKSRSGSNEKKETASKAEEASTLKSEWREQTERKEEIKITNRMDDGTGDDVASESDVPMDEEMRDVEEERRSEQTSQVSVKVEKVVEKVEKKEKPVSAPVKSSSKETSRNDTIRNSGGDRGGSGKKSGKSAKSSANNRGDVIMIANKAIPYSSINNTDRSGRTILFKVSGNGDVNAVTALIRAGADVNAKDNAGWSPLHEASLEGQLATATLLIQYGADVNALGFENQTPLHDAVGSTHYDVVELLLSHGASLTAVNKDGNTPLDEAGEDETMVQLLQLWKRMTAKVVEVDEHGVTLLHQYAGKGDVKGVKRCLKYGAEVDFADNAGWTPLHEACCKGFHDVVEELCRYGADVNVKSLEAADGVGGVTPLMDAASVGSLDSVRVLLEYGADTSLTDSTGKRATDYAKEGEESNGLLELLKRERDSWKPFRKPDFIKTKPGCAGGMMAHIRDQASAMLAKSEGSIASVSTKDPKFKVARKNSVSSDTSHSTNFTGSLNAKGISVSASTAAAVGLGGPNAFSWGGLDPREREGPFVSSREERKFNALLKTLGGGGNGSGGEGSPAAVAPVAQRAKSGPKPKKKEDSIDDRKGGGKKLPRIDSEDERDNKKRMHKSSNKDASDESDDNGGGKSKRPKHAESDNEESGESGSEADVQHGTKRGPSNDSDQDEEDIIKSKKKKLEKESKGKKMESSGKPQIKDKLASAIFDEEDVVAASKKEAPVRPPLPSVSQPAAPVSKKDRFGVRPPAPLPVKTDTRPLVGSTLKKVQPVTPAAPTASTGTVNSTATGTTSATNSVSPLKKKIKKRNMFGISGYKKAGDEPDQPLKSDDPMNVDGIDSTASSAMDLFSSVDAAKATATLKHRLLKSLPLYKINLPPQQPSAAALLIPKKAFRTAANLSSAPIAYFTDLQIALYLGKQSGRQVLELFPSLSTRVATLSQKQALTLSPVSESCFNSIMESRRRSTGIEDASVPRWIQWTDRGDGKKGLRFEELDVQFLKADEVLKELRGWKGEKKLENLFDDSRNGSDEAVGDEFVENLDVEELDLDKFVDLTRNAGSVVAGSGNVENKGIDVALGLAAIASIKKPTGLEPSKALNLKFKNLGVVASAAVKVSK
ncbi:hypothetical protein HDU79_001288 [Rhizoclosmatium sp. JEL0117]|nr:hypothetical protein HDU79_001288 [Rhizoclosmatium sp. JEL0117]